MTAQRDRRSVLVKIVTTGMGLVTAGLAALAGYASSPTGGGGGKRWRRAASIFDLPASQPLTAVLTERHADGWYETRQQSVVFIDRDRQGYRAFSAVCQHLGCRVKWDEGVQQYLCPCHGGIYDRDGNVVAGPPPRGLVKLNVRVNPQTSDVEVEL